MPTKDDPLGFDDTPTPPPVAAAPPPPVAAGAAAAPKNDDPLGFDSETVVNGNGGGADAASGTGGIPSLDQRHTYALNQDAARQGVPINSAVEGATAPFRNWGPDYDRYRNAGVESMQHGLQDVEQPGAWNKVKGAAKMASGAMGYTMSPVEATVNSFVGRPVEQASGAAATAAGFPDAKIPAEWTNFAAESTIPGMGFTKLPGAGAAAALDAGARGTSLVQSEPFADALAQSGLGLSPGDIPARMYGNLAQKVDQVGLSPAAIRDALTEGTTGVTSRAVATGKKAATEGGQHAAAGSIEDAQKKVADNISSYAGEHGVDEAGLGQAALGVREGSKNAYGTLYDGVASEPGIFHPGVRDYILNHVKNSLLADNGISSWDQFANTTQLGKANEAVSQLSKELAGVPDNALNLRSLQWARKTATRTAREGTPEDINAAGTIGHAFDRATQSAVSTPGGFVGGDAATAGSKLADANRAFSQHQNTFQPRNMPSGPRGAFNSVKSDFANASADDFGRAGSALGKSLLNPVESGQTYNYLHGIGLGDHATDFLRTKLTTGSPAQVQANMNHPLAGRVFSPTELQELKTNSAVGGALAKPLGRPEQLPGFVRGAQQVARYGVPLAGLVHGSLTGENPFLQAGVESLTGLAGEQMGERGLGAYAAAREAAGAPDTRPLLSRAGAGAQKVVGNPVGAQAATSAANAVVNGPAEEDVRREYAAHPERFNELTVRPGHAAGGKVGHQHLVDRLLRGVETAKKAEKLRTSVILKQPDETVAKALNVAQAAI